MERGLYPTVDDTAKIVMLLQNGGEYNDEQLLHASRTKEALYRGGSKGIPTRQSVLRHGDQAYHMSFWSVPHRTKDGCYFQIPFASGHGGNTIFLAPNGVSTFVFTDYGPNTYSFNIPAFVEGIRPLSRRWG